VGIALIVSLTLTTACACASASGAEFEPSSTASTGGGRTLRDLCSDASSIYSAVMNADSGLRNRQIDEADWRSRIAGAESSARALLAVTPSAEAPMVQAVVDALAALPKLPTGVSPAGATVLPAFEQVRTACRSNGTEIVVTAEFGG